MTKSSYRFDGSSFIGSKYVYVGPSSAPCRKTTGPVNISMPSKDLGWRLSGSGTYIYKDCDNFCAQWASAIQNTLTVLCEPYTPPVYVGSVPLEISIDYTLGNPLTYEYAFSFAYIRIYKSDVLQDTIISYTYAETLKYTFTTSGSYNVYLNVNITYTGESETGCPCSAGLSYPKYSFLLS